MSRLYFGMKTNLPISKADEPTAQLDYIAFETKDGTKHITVSCCGESEYGQSATGYSGRWKDLETSVETADGKTIDDWTPMIASDLNLLRDASIYEIGVYLPDVEYDNPVVAKDIDVEIEFGDENLQYHSHYVRVMEWGDGGKKVHIERGIAA